jgi:hypothetical protein
VKRTAQRIICLKQILKPKTKFKLKLKQKTSGHGCWQLWFSFQEKSSNKLQGSHAVRENVQKRLSLSHKNAPLPILIIWFENKAIKKKQVSKYVSSFNWVRWIV